MSEQTWSTSATIQTFLQRRRNHWKRHRRSACRSDLPGGAPHWEWVQQAGRGFFKVLTMAREWCSNRCSEVPKNCLVLANWRYRRRSHKEHCRRRRVPNSRRRRRRSHFQLVNPLSNLSTRTLLTIIKTVNTGKELEGWCRWRLPHTDNLRSHHRHSARRTFEIWGVWTEWQSRTLPKTNWQPKRKPLSSQTSNYRTVEKMPKSEKRDDGETNLPKFSGWFSKPEILSTEQTMCPRMQKSIANNTACKSIGGLQPV